MSSIKFQNAHITDIVRCYQRDESFTNELQDYVLPLLKIFGQRKYHHFLQFVHPFTVVWYYALTSLSNLQTLGEEYTGIIRTRNHSIPSTFVRLLWLVLLAGGEPLFDKVLKKTRSNVNKSSELTETAKRSLIKWMDFIRENKHIFARMHHSIFYMNGKYNYIANRITGIRYILLREWVKDETQAKSLRFLGRASFFYLLLNLIHKAWQQRDSPTISTIASDDSTSKNLCTLCVDNRKNTSATPCGHLFCWECIFDCLRYQAFCPVCREQIQPSRIVLLQNYF